jgi:dihydrodiol dehydrogenase / D-xylose 1-dehydrogenase (NADP)
LVQLAKERNLFCLEGMWTRFFPAVEQARRLTSKFSKDRVLGEIVQVHSDFNFNASDSEEYPTSFVYNHALGGGASLLVGKSNTNCAYVMCAFVHSLK